MIAKLKTNKPLTENDIDSLEEILWKEIGTKQDYENEIGQKPLGEFVREIVGLDMNAAKEAFSAYLSDTNMDSRQIYFVNQIIEYIVHNGMLKDLSVLQESPFTDQAVSSIFSLICPCGWGSEESSIRSTQTQPHKGITGFHITKNTDTGEEQHG